MKELIELEIKLLDPQVRKDPASLLELLDESFIEVIPSGQIWNRAQIIEALLSDQSPDTYIASSFTSHLVSEEVVILTYTLGKDSGNHQSIRSSLWKRVNNSWKMVFHQGTLIK